METLRRVVDSYRARPEAGELQQQPQQRSPTTFVVSGAPPLADVGASHDGRQVAHHFVTPLVRDREHDHDGH